MAKDNLKIAAIFVLVFLSSLVVNPLSQFVVGLVFRETHSIDWFNVLSLSFTLAVVLTVFAWYKQFSGKTVLFARTKKSKKKHK